MHKKAHKDWESSELNDQGTYLLAKSFGFIYFGVIHSLIDWITCLVPVAVKDWCVRVGVGKLRMCSTT